jgi:hypothetical protein
MKVQILKNIVLMSSLSLFALACSESVGEDAKEGATPGECEDGADNDGDGYYDCDDNDCFTAPACRDGVDTGDPIDDDDVDGDNDGFTPNEGDCDDDDKKVHPDAKEKCNDIDDDCDGIKDNDPVDGDTYYEDWDNDGYGDSNNAMEACDQPNGYVENDDDCDDTDSLVRPGGNEISWNGVDEDCDGTDFNGLSCAEGAAEDALWYISYYAYWVADETGSYLSLENWAITNQILYIDYNEGQAVNIESADGGSTNLGISMDTFIAMNSASNPFDVNLTGLYDEHCWGNVPWMDLKFEGDISINVAGTTIDSTVNMNAVWDGLIQDNLNLNSACNLSDIDFAINWLYDEGYLPFSNLLAFFDNSYKETADALADVIESEVKWFIDYECSQ